VLLLFIGFTGSGFTKDSQKSMSPGDHLRIGEYTIGLIGIRGDRDFEREAIFADLEVRGPSGDMGVISPARFHYFSHPKQATSEVVIKTGLFEDLFLILGEANPESGRAVIRAVINPLVLWIWLGGILLVIGTFVAVVPAKWFVTLLEMKQETKSVLSKPFWVLLICSAFVSIVITFGNIPIGLATIGAILLVLALYSMSKSITSISKRSDG